MRILPAALCIVLMLAVQTARAQNASVLAENLQRQLNVEDTQFRSAFLANTPIDDRLLLDAGGTFRYGFSIIDNAKSQEQLQFTYDARLFLRAELDGGIRFFGRLRFLYNNWEYTGTLGLGPDPREDGWQWPVGEIYWGEFDLAGYTESKSGRKWADFNLIVRGGRNYIVWAQGLVLSNYVYAFETELKLGDLVVTGIVAESAGYDTVDYDTSRPGYDTDTSRLYSGAKLEWKGIAGHTPYAYYLWQQDLNGGQQDTLYGTVPTTFRYNSGYVGGGSTGSVGANLIYRSEVAWEYGNTLSDPLDPTSVTGYQAQVTDSINAGAGVLGLTWLARDAGDTRVDFQGLVGTGSGNRYDSGTTFGGIAPHKTDTSFNSLGYINTGLALAPEPANLFCPSLGVSSNVLPSVDLLSELRLGASGFLFMKVDNEAPVSVLTVPGGSNLIGGEVDCILDWRISSDVNLNLRYGIFLPNTSVFFPGQGGARDFFYSGVTYAF